MLGVVAVSIVSWFVTRESLPREIRLAAAKSGGLYSEFATKLKPYLEERTGRSLLIQTTQGSVENVDLLRRREVHLAIVQAGTTDLEGVVALAPLYPDVVHVVVRKGSDIQTIHGFAGRQVSIGPLGSGMRQAAGDLLSHYGIREEDLEPNDAYFLALLEDRDPPLEAAIVTTGLLNPDLAKLLKDDRFELLALDADAISVRYPYFEPFTIPRGMYAEAPAQPPQPVATVATMSYLAARSDATDILVEETLACLYEQFPPSSFPAVVPPSEAATWSAVPLHSAARNFHDPYRGLGLLADFMDSLAGIKELLFALGAGLYLLWLRWKRIKEQEVRAQVARQMRRLNELIDETARIERAQMFSQDPVELKRFLDEVTFIKLRGLREMSHEDLRGDRMFSIFLMQCANLIRKIQGKLILLAEGGVSSAAKHES
jgi:TRAP transporter TAXI family solute receptor